MKVQKLKATELRDKSVGDLKLELDAQLKQQFDHRMAHAGETLEQVKELRTLRRNIARVRTILNQKTQESVGS